MISRLLILISSLVLASNAQIQKPETVQPLTIPAWPGPEDGEIEETYAGQVNITWQDGSGYSVNTRFDIFLM